MNYSKLIKTLLIIFLGALAILYTAKTTFVEIPMQGTVVSKATSSDRNGYISYHTIISGDDGKVYDKSGIRFYAVPVGKKVSWTEEEFQFK